jgi:hypothetical protein
MNTTDAGLAALCASSKSVVGTTQGVGTAIALEAVLFFGVTITGGYFLSRGVHLSPRLGSILAATGGIGALIAGKMDADWQTTLRDWQKTHGINSVPPGGPPPAQVLLIASGVAAGIGVGVLIESRKKR